MATYGAEPPHGYASYQQQGGYPPTYPPQYPPPQPQFYPEQPQYPPQPGYGQWQPPAKEIDPPGPFYEETPLQVIATRLPFVFLLLLLLLLLLHLVLRERAFIPFKAASREVPTSEWIS